MQLTDDDIQEFRAMWRQEFHEDITPAEARASASLLIELYLALLRQVEAGATRDLEAQDEQPP